MFDVEGKVIVFDGTVDEDAVLSEMWDIDWLHYINTMEGRGRCEPHTIQE